MDPTQQGTGQPMDAGQTPPFTGQNAQPGAMPMSAPGSTPTVQRTEGEGRTATHTHAATTHTHDHYHVTHHHRGGPLAEWEHRTQWHTHEHNHNALTHSHDFGQDEEDREHGKEGHIHDHAAPTHSPA
jgi:hypothetical protein